MLSYMNCPEDLDAPWQFYGVPFASVGNPFPGCVNGPTAVRMTAFDLSEPLVYITANDKHARLEPGIIADVGDAPLNDDRVAVQEMADLFKAGKRVVVVGGDDTVSHMAIEAFNTGTNESLSTVISLDAHLDCEDEYLYHGSWVRHVVQDYGMEAFIIGARGMQVPGAYEYPTAKKPFRVYPHSFLSFSERMETKSITGPVALSVDMDVFDPSAAPGVGYRVAGGPPSTSILGMVEDVMSAYDVRMLIVTELNSDRDVADQTANLANTVILHALASSV